jgi:hypothetical protein
VPLQDLNKDSVIIIIFRYVRTLTKSSFLPGRYQGVVEIALRCCYWRQGSEQSDC